MLPVPEARDLVIPPGDLAWKACFGSGPGGQARNKLATAIQLTHKPTGLMVRAESEKSQHRNRETALAVLRARLLAQKQARQQADRASERRSQVGSGMRGDKIRTLSVPNGVVKDHRTGRKMPLKKYLRGEQFGG